MLAIIQQTGDELVGLTPQDNISSVKLTAGGIDELKYTIYPTSEAFNTATERITEVTAIDKQFAEEVFRGRVRSISGKADSSTSQTITCEGAAARLRDGYFNGSVKPGDLNSFTFNKILTMHNELVDDAGKIYIGTVPQGAVSIYKAFDYVPTIDVINEVTADMGYEWRIRFDDVNGVYKLDVAEFFGGYAAEPIVVGSNLGSIKYTTDPSGVATRIIPLGGIGYDGERLTVRTYAGRNSIYMDNTELIEKYGVIVRTVIHDDIALDDMRNFSTKVAELYSAGLEDVQALTDKAVTWEVSAVDLARAGYNIDTFRVGWYYNIMHPTLETNVILRLVEMTIDYRNPQRSKLVFGDKAATLTSSISTATNTAIARTTAQIINVTQIIDSRMDGIRLIELTEDAYNALQYKQADTLYVATTGSDFTLYFGVLPLRSGGGSSYNPVAALRGSGTPTATVLNHATLEE